MKSKNVDLLNVLLIAISLVVAFKLPFELFLFSYAVLGPLHYVTEINWLKGKNYFVKERRWMWIFAVFAAVIAIPPILRLPALSSLRSTVPVKTFLTSSNFITNLMILVSLIFAIGLVYFKKGLHLFLFLLGTIGVSAVILLYVPVSFVLVGIFIPTIIHVYIFTLLFMIFGTMNNKSSAGVTAIIFLILAPLIIAISNIEPETYLPSESTRNIYSASGFVGLSQKIADFIGANEDGQFFALSAAGIKIQIFIAFCYTYHYLNWFSKTTVIGWSKNISKGKLVVILVIWFAAIFLYWYDYKTGFIALLFLSFFHVLLEFPLNITSIKGIASKIGAKQQPQVATVSNVIPSKNKGKK